MGKRARVQKQQWFSNILQQWTYASACLLLTEKYRANLNMKRLWLDFIHFIQRVFSFDTILVPVYFRVQPFTSS